MLSPAMTHCPLPTGSTPPPRSLASWLTSRGLGRTQDETTACIPHDIYVIGTQENSLGDREWVEFLRASLKTLMAIDYRVVMSGHSLDPSGWSRLPAAITPGLLPPKPRALSHPKCSPGNLLRPVDPMQGVPSPGAAFRGWVGSPCCSSAPTGPPQVALQCLWSIKIVVLVKPEHERRISHVHTSSVKTGIANTLGREGG